MLEGIEVPLPMGQRVEVTVERGERWACALGTEAPGCAVDEAD